MSKISRCSRCGGNIVEPAYPGDGAYPVGRMCECGSLDERSKRVIAQRIRNSFIEDSENEYE